MHTPVAAQKAKARARQRSRPFAPANDNVVRLSPAPPLELTAGDVVRDDADDAPFAPPPADDIFGLDECEEEETIFVAVPPPNELAAAEKPPVEAIEDDAPFDPPEFDDEPVFSAPASAQLAPVAVAAPKPEPKPLQAREEEPRKLERPLPAISIYASWDRGEAETLLHAFAADPRLGRAEIEIARGGLDGAAAHCATHDAPDLVILDTTLQGGPMLAGLDRLRAAAPRAAIVVLGSVNDITLLRELAARGVSDYIVAPAGANELASSLCRLFAHASPARTIAVIGARGGVGASTIAHNIAWSIAERQQKRTTLADFDLSFGAAAFNFQQSAGASIAEVLASEDDPGEALSQALSALTPRLQLLAAPERVECVDIAIEPYERAMAEVRRSSAYVVLDLPHVWEPWVRQTLREADEVVIVAAPDLASLRNTDNMLKLLRSERDKASAPMIVLSMAGIPKRPEIPLKDFAEAIHVKPVMTFAFEPELFGRASAQGQMIYEAMPDSKAALQVDTLASLLTGREPFATPAPRVRAKAPELKQESEVSAPAPVETEKAPELPILDLTVAIPNASPPKPAKRRAARTGFLALQEPPAAPKQRRGSSGLVRMAAAVLVLVLAGVYFVQQRAIADGAPQPATGAFRA